jgi:hypothetical protein
MKSKREESFKKIEGETFYTSPPYNYRPSIAEYLTSLNVTKNGFIADIMHLDYKGNIKIKSIKEDCLNIILIDDKDLNMSELFIWDYLKSLEKNKEIILYIKKIPKSVLSEFSALVIIKTSQKFKPESSKYGYNLDSTKIISYRRTLFWSRIIVGIIFTFFGFLSFISIVVGLHKLSKQPSDIKFFLKKFVLRYFFRTLIYFIFLGFVLLLTAISSTSKLPLLPLLIVLGFVLLVFFYKYSKVSYDYVSWLFESKEASEHRSEWIKFKSFVISNSEIENKPLGHYTLWGPFYYYTLAVGSIKEKI